MKNNKRNIPRYTLFMLALGLALGAALAPETAHASGLGGIVYINISVFLGKIGGYISAIFDAIFGAQACSGLPTVGQAICNIIASATWIPGLISGIAYLAGLSFGIMGILKIRDHVERADRTPLSDGLKYFLAGGALFALPIVTESLYNAVNGPDHNLVAQSYSGFTGRTSGYGLDTAMVAFIKDIWYPFHDMLGGFAYIAGLILTVVGIMRLVKSSQEGARGPTGFGTIMTFLIAGVLFSLNSVMGVFSFSTFGDNVTSTAPVLMYTDGMTGAEVGHVQAVISAIVGFVALVGWVSFIRGWFIIRGVAEGNSQASLMAGVTHVFGGALAVNLGPLLNAVQYTLGLTGFGVAFL